MTKQLDWCDEQRAIHVAKVNEDWAKRAAEKKKLIEEKSTKPKKI